MAKLTVTKKDKLDQYRKLLRDNDIEPDTIDLQALIDPQVGYDANKRALEAELGTTLTASERKAKANRQQEEAAAGNAAGEKRYKERAREKRKAQNRAIRKAQEAKKQGAIPNTPAPLGSVPKAVSDALKGATDDQIRYALARTRGEEYMVTLREWERRKAGRKTADAGGLLELLKAAPRA